MSVLLHVCSPQCSPRDAVKDHLYDQLRAMPAISSATASLIPYGGCNSNGGRTGPGYKDIHGDYHGYDKPVPDTVGESILEYALSQNLLFCNI